MSGHVMMSYQGIICSWFGRYVVDCMHVVYWCVVIDSMLRVNCWEVCGEGWWDILRPCMHVVYWWVTIDSMPCTCELVGDLWGRLVGYFEAMEFD